MSKAAVVYRSRTGTTRAFAEEIAAFLVSRGVDARAESVGDCDPAALASVDFLLLGCWTSGLFVVAQHPDRPWVDFVRDMPVLKEPRVALFTTYKLVTGSMFGRMREELAGKTSPPRLELKSRDGHLADRQRRELEAFIAP
jgi:flavodoxin